MLVHFVVVVVGRCSNSGLIRYGNHFLPVYSCPLVGQNWQETMAKDTLSMHL